MKNIGFIGLGIMGKPMAGHLIKAGHRLFLHSRSGVPEELIEQGGQSTASPKEVAERADVIFTMVPDTPDVEKVLFGEQGIVQGLQSRKGLPCIVVDMSSIAPLATIKFAERIKALGHEYVDAPVSGGDVGAKNATLTIMVGANQTVFETVKPLFELMGKTITHVGENGAGQICKVANQILVSITIEAVAEALLFAAKAGADPHKVCEALMGGFAASKALEVHGARMLNRQFDPGFRVELHHKDLNIALATASALGVSLPNTATVRELFAACLAHDGAKWDNSAIIKMLEKLSNYEVPTYSK